MGTILDRWLIDFKSAGGEIEGTFKIRASNITEATERGKSALSEEILKRVEITRVNKVS